MFTKIQQLWLRSDTSEAENFLSRWKLTATANGDLHISSLQESISFDDVRDVIDRLSRLGDGDNTRFIFNLSTVKSISSPWTAVFAMFVDFARRCGRRCHLTAMSDSLTAMATLVTGRSLIGGNRLSA